MGNRRMKKRQKNINNKMVHLNINILIMCGWSKHIYENRDHPQWNKSKRTYVNREIHYVYELENSIL